MNQDLKDDLADLADASATMLKSALLKIYVQVPKSHELTFTYNPCFNSSLAPTQSVHGAAIGCLDPPTLHLTDSRSFRML